MAIPKEDNNNNIKNNTGNQKNNHKKIISNRQQQQQQHHSIRPPNPSLQGQLRTALSLQLAPVVLGRYGA